MLNGKSLTQLATEIERQQSAKKDFVADTRVLRLTGAGQLVAPAIDPLPVNSLAHRQIAAHTGIPAKYYERMLADDGELLAHNVNHWFTASPSNRMVRTLDGRARAVLSDRYQRIDNFDVASTVLPVLAEARDLNVVSTEITEGRLYIKAVTPRIAGEIKRGDEVQAGVMITNSEVGLGQLSIQPLVYRLVCLNGMVLPDAAFKRRHVGSRANAAEDGIYEILSDETRRSDDRTILLKVRDVLRASLDEAVFGRRLAELRATTERKIEGNPVKAVEVLGASVGLTQGEQGGVLRHLIEGGDLSQWGIVNAVTAFAHRDVTDYDRSTELEAAGGIIVNLPANDWRRIATAA